MTLRFITLLHVYSLLSIVHFFQNIFIILISTSIMIFIHGVKRNQKFKREEEAVDFCCDELTSNSTSILAFLPFILFDNLILLIFNSFDSTQYDDSYEYEKQKVFMNFSC